MKKILLINNGMKFQGYLFAKALSKHYEVVLAGRPMETAYEYPIDEEWYDKHFMQDISSDRIKKFDIILGLDQGATPIIASLKENYPDKKCGVHILDYPAHVFRPNKNYNEGACNTWKSVILPHLKTLDFTIHNQNNSLFLLNKYLGKNKVHKFVKYPVNPMPIETLPSNSYIVYSGRLHADKGVHYILSALALIDKSQRPGLITIGSGFDFKPLADYLKINYTNVDNCSERKKWDIYSTAKFLVCAADNPYIPALSILEGLSIGKTGIVFDYEENRLHYKDLVHYVEPCDIVELATAIKGIANDEWARYNGEQEKINIQDRIRYCQMECSYEAWALNVKKVIDESKK